MAYEISIEKTTNSRIGEVDFENIQFGRVFSDHMFIADYYRGRWNDLRIVPFGNLSLHPATTALHYGQAIFEGLKGYRHVEDGTPMLFRPDKNSERLNKSAARIAMPELPADLFLEALTKLIQLDKEWIPQKEGSSLYVRPYMFATDEYVGIKASDNYKFVIFTGPVGAYYSQPVKVKVADEYVRAFPGGTGAAKVAGNYAATLYPVQLARKEGYDQILWTDAYERKYMQEIGTMNVFFIINGKVITPTLDEGTILDGITRNSIITLLKAKGYPVEERRISIDEVLEAYNNGTLEDAFGSGTAATLSHISEIGYKDQKLVLPAIEERTISTMIQQEMNDIKTGRAADPYGWMFRIETPVTELH